MLGATTIVFALQNISVVTVSFFAWEITGSLSLVLLLAVTSGVLIAMLLLLPEFISNHFRHKSLTEENKRLKEDLEKQKQLTHFAKQNPPTHEDIAKIEQGAISDTSHV